MHKCKVRSELCLLPPACAILPKLLTFCFIRQAPAASAPASGNGSAPARGGEGGAWSVAGCHAAAASPLQSEQEAEAFRSQQQQQPSGSQASAAWAAGQRVLQVASLLRKLKHTTGGGFQSQTLCHAPQLGLDPPRNLPSKCSQRCRAAQPAVSGRGLMLQVWRQQHRSWGLAKMRCGFYWREHCKQCSSTGIPPICCWL